MNRIAQKWLSEWKHRPSRKPLVLRGARQVGKTYLVQNWGAESFQTVVTVDLERERDFHKLFLNPDPVTILAEIALLKGKSIAPGNSLLFLDEIQACPAALSSLRYFYELMPDLHVIAAGSLLDFALRDFSHSMPVGRIEFMHLHPLSYEEFLAATEGQASVDYLHQMDPRRPISEAVEKKFLESVRRYFFVGGMPEAVRTFKESGNLLDVQRVQSSLVETVQDDFAKYGPHRLHDLMRKCYGHVALSVGRKLKYVNISREDRAPDVRKALELLTMSRVVSLVFHTSANGLPLGAEKDDRQFKSLFLDIGLMNRMCGLDMLNAEELITVNEGAMAEQFVGQQLLCSKPSFEDPQLFYWSRESRSSNAEVNYVWSRHKDILPIEVKAGKKGTLRSTLQFLLEKKGTLAVRVHSGSLAWEKIKLPGEEEPTVDLLSLPLYAIGELDRLLSQRMQSPVRPA